MASCRFPFQSSRWCNKKYGSRWTEGNHQMALQAHIITSSGAEDGGFAIGQTDTWQATFTNVGVDCFGPFMVNQGRSGVKDSAVSLPVWDCEQYIWHLEWWRCCSSTGFYSPKVFSRYRVQAPFISAKTEKSLFFPNSELSKTCLSKLLSKYLWYWWKIGEIHGWEEWERLHSSRSMWKAYTSQQDNSGRNGWINCSSRGC